MNSELSERKLWHEIAKYPPARYHNRVFMDDDWTSPCDIGTERSGHILTIDEYLEMEHNYINTLTQILEASGCRYLTIHHAEVHVRNVRSCLRKSKLGEPIHATLSRILSIEEEQRVSLKTVAELFKYCLREYIYLEFTNDSRKVAVKPGYDYYMYIKTPLPVNVLRPIVNSNNLFLDPR